MILSVLFTCYEVSHSSRLLLVASNPSAVPTAAPTITEPPPATTVPPATTAAVPGGADLLCNIPYPELGHCAAGVHGMTNAPDLFKMTCGAYGSCAFSTFSFEYDATSNVEFIEGLFFTDSYSGYKTTINVVNNQKNGIELVVDHVDCTGFGSCQHMDFQLGKAVDIGDFVCAPNACAGCTITENGEVPPRVTPCDSF